MAYGFQIRDSSGSVIYDSLSVTWLQLGSFTVPATGNAVYNFPSGDQFSEVIVQQWFINTPPTDQEAISHTVTQTVTSGNLRISVNGGNQAQGVLVLGR